MLASTLGLQVYELVASDPLDEIARTSAEAAERLASSIQMQTDERESALMRAAAARLMISVRDDRTEGFVVTGIGPEYLIRRTLRPFGLELDLLEEVLVSFKLGGGGLMSERARSLHHLRELAAVGEPDGAGGRAATLIQLAEVSEEHEREALDLERELMMVDALAARLRQYVQFRPSPSDDPFLQRIESWDGVLAERRRPPGGGAGVIGPGGSPDAP